MPANQRRVRMPVCWSKRCKADKEEDGKIMKTQCIIFDMCTVYIYIIFWYVYVWIIRVLLGAHSDTRHWLLFAIDGCSRYALSLWSTTSSTILQGVFLCWWISIDRVSCIWLMACTVEIHFNFQHIPSMCIKSYIPGQPMHCNFPTWIWPKKRFLVRGLWVAPCCNSWVTSLVV